MPKSKKTWKVFVGRIGPAWKGTEADIAANFVTPKEFRFDRIEWRGKEYTVYFVKDA